MTVGVQGVAVAAVAAAEIDWMRIEHSVVSQT